MSESYLTVGKLVRCLNDCLDCGLLKPKEPIIILENDSEINYNGRTRVDFFDVMWKCNLAGVVYNENKKERGFVMSFSHETPKYDFESAIRESPTTGNRILMKMDFNKKELPKDETK